MRRYLVARQFFLVAVVLGIMMVLPQPALSQGAGGKMYWTDPDTAKIQRADLDGMNVEDLVTTGLDAPLGIALDVAGGKMYWVHQLPGKIQRADLDGMNVADLVTGLSGLVGIALDVAWGKMYWTDTGPGKIQRADLDGMNVVDLVTTGVTNPVFIALDIRAVR